MTAIFNLAHQAMRNSNLTESALLKTGQGEFVIRMVPNTGFSQVFSNYHASVPVLRTEAILFKGDYDNDDLENAIIEVNGETFKIDGIIGEDAYTKTVSTIPFFIDDDEFEEIEENHE